MPTRASFDPSKETRDVFTDEVHDIRNYEYFKKMSATVGKPLHVTRQPTPPPANALVVTRAQLTDHQAYLMLKARAAREGKMLWLEE
jgi:hypothetical protein